MTAHHMTRIRALSPEGREALAAALRARGASSRPTELAAYFVAEGSVSAAEVRAFLEGRLPEHLVPSELCELPALPKAVNGKIDRQALRGRVSPTERLPEAPARSAREQRLARIWSRVLQRPVVDADADFFALGGHSLLATQVVMEIEQQFGVEMPLAAILKNPTVARLSRYLEGAAPIAARAPADESDDDSPLSHGQRRLWYASQLSDAGLEYKVLKVLDLRGRFSSEGLAQAIGEIVKRHETLRTTFGYAGGRLTQRVQPPAPVAVEHVDLSGLAPAQRDRAYERTTDALVARPFDLDTGPLLRVSVVRHTASHVRVFFDVHHIVIDGWSVGLLVEELNALSRDFAAGLPGRLAPLRLQYRDVVRAEKRRLDPADLDRQVAYWRDRLRGVPPLEFRLLRPPLPAEADGEVPFALGEDVSRRIAETSAQLQVTPYMVLLAAYYVLLSAHASAHDVAIGTDVSNRDTADHARLIGFFANQVILRLTSSPQDSFEALCRHVRQTVEGAFENKAAPYDAVVRALGGGGARVRPFRAMFSFHHRLPDLAFEGLQTKFVDARPPRSKYDLLVNVEEGPAGLQGSVEYSGSVFGAEAARTIARQFASLCACASQDVATPVAELTSAVRGDVGGAPADPLATSRAARRRSLEWIVGQVAGRSGDEGEVR